MDKVKALQRLEQEVKQCKICPLDKTGVLVFGEGNPDAEVMFVGEAPGKQEAKTGRPFIGRSGQLLRKCIREVGLKEEDVYITSPVKYLPLRGTPTLQDIEHSKIHFVKQLSIINPKIIVLLGNTAAIALLGEKIPIMKRHGEILNKNGHSYFISLHPAAAIRFQKFMSLFTEDFKKIKTLLMKK